MSYAEKMEKLVQLSGGTIEDGLFVTEPGVKLLACTELAEGSRELFDAMNIDDDRPDYEQLAEFNSRVTYLSFNDESSSSKEYNRKMVDEFGHLSVHSSYQATFLLAGVALETCLELVAHSEASVSRLTSSRTKAQDRPLFRISGGESERQLQKEITSHISERVQDNHGYDGLSKDERERINRLYGGNKCTALTYTMTIKDFHKTFIGRLSHHGVESGMREVCEKMCDVLHGKYPLVVRKPDHYYQLNNAEKYEMG